MHTITSKISKISGSKYHEYKCPKKVKINNTLIKLAKKYLNNNISNPIILDGKNMQSTNILLTSDANITGKINIPEIDEETHDIHKNSELCNAYYGSLGSFINDKQNKETVKQTNFIFADYTGSVSGNYSENYYPMQDIHDVLKTTKSKKLVLGLTFCQRSRIPLKKSVRENMVDKIRKDFVKPCIKYCGYKIIKGGSYSYKREAEHNKKTQPMVFFGYVLKKTNKFKNTNIKFIQGKRLINNKNQRMYLGYDPNQ